MRTQAIEAFERKNRRVYLKRVQSLQEHWKILALVKEKWIDQVNKKLKYEKF